MRKRCERATEREGIDSVLPRRKFLGYLASRLSPLPVLTSCGGGGSAGDQETTAVANGIIATSNSQAAAPLVTFFQYSGSADLASTVAPEQQLVGLSPAADRFAAEGSCPSFSGAASRAIVPGLPQIGGGDFALSLWLCTTTARAMRVLTLSGPLGTAIGINVNADAAVSVSGSDAGTIITGGRAGDLSDGSWHHLVMQRAGAFVQLFVDGAAVGTKAQTLPAFAALQVGGQEEAPWQGEVDDVRLHNRSFSAAAITAMVYSWQQEKPSNRADSVAAYYPFNGNATNNTGKGFEGRPVNVTPVANRNGDAAGAYSFNGVDSYIELQDSFDRARLDFTIALWVRSSAQKPMTALSISPGACDLELVFNDGVGLKLVVDGHVDASMAFGRSGEFADGRWHFVLLQRVAGRFELHVDGMVRGTADGGPDPYGPGSTVRIGRSSGALGQAPGFWSGEIDDLQIYECSFSVQDIRNLELLEFRPRDGAATVAFADKMWLFGGWNPADAESTDNEVWSSTDGRHWTFVANAPWEPRHTPGCVVFDNRVWIIGGDTNRGHYQNDVWSSADGIHWDFVTDQVPWADRTTQYTLVHNDRMWLMGGQKLRPDPTGPVVAYNDVYSSADGLNWRLEMRQAPWCPRGLILGSAVFLDRMWVIGGGTYDIRTYQNDVWSSADGSHWDLVVEHAPWSARQYHCVAVFDNKIWVVAGGTVDDPGGVNEAWYSADGTRWTQVQSPWNARHAASVVAHRNGLWVIAGSSGAVYNDVWRLGYSD